MLAAWPLLEALILLGQNFVSKLTPFGTQCFVLSRITHVPLKWPSVADSSARVSLWTTIISFSLVSRVWGDLLASFQWSARPSAADRQVSGSHLVLDPRGTAGARGRHKELAR